MNKDLRFRFSTSEVNRRGTSHVRQSHDVLGLFCCLKIFFLQAGIWNLGKCRICSVSFQGYSISLKTCYAHLSICALIHIRVRIYTHKHIHERAHTQTHARANNRPHLQHRHAETAYSRIHFFISVFKCLPAVPLSRPVIKLRFRTTCLTLRFLFGSVESIPTNLVLYFDDFHTIKSRKRSSRCILSCGNNRGSLVAI